MTTTAGTEILNTEAALALSERALIPLADEHLIVDQWALSRIGTLPLTIEKAGRTLDRITKIVGAARYWRGDLLNLSETLFGEEASQIIDAEMMSEADVKIERLVAEKVAPSVRAHAPSWEHSKAVVKLGAEEQVEWLDRAMSEGWSAGKLKTEMSLAGKAKTFLQWMCVVDCGTETKRDKLAERLEGEGFTVLKRDKVKKQSKPKKAKREVTARKKRAQKASTKPRKA